MAQRKFHTLEIMNLILLIHRIVCINELVPALVKRQLGNDTINFNSAHDVISCDTDDKVTYLVDDKMCVSNQELFKGICSIRYTVHTGIYNNVHA